MSGVVNVLFYTHKKLSLNILLPKIGFITCRFLLFGRIFKNYFYIAALAVLYSCDALRRLGNTTLLPDAMTILDRKFLTIIFLESVKKKKKEK